MGWKFRKSSKVGPFRFTLTHRGITSSFGAGGLRYYFNKSGKRKKQIAPGYTTQRTSLGSLAGALIVCIGGFIAFGAFISAFSSGDKPKPNPPQTFSDASSVSLVTPSTAQPIPQINNSSIDETAPPATSTSSQSARKENSLPVRKADSAPQSNLPFRSWMSASGTHTTSARLITAVGASTYLQKEDGQNIINVPIDKLSRADQEYVAENRPGRILHGSVAGVLEGDIITIGGANPTKVRLLGIDAPEKLQTFFEESRKALKKKVYQKEVTVEWSETDENGVVFGNVLCDGIWINKDLVDEGWAWQRGESPILIESQIEAKARRLGVWIGSDPIAPWDFKPPGSETTIARDDSASDTFGGGRPSRPKTPSNSPPSTSPSAYSSGPGYAPIGSSLNVGPRGGVYHYSKNGNKVYEKHK